MDQAVTFAKAAAALLLLAATHAHAAMLPDPMRPPAAASGADATAANPSGAPRLQSILVARAAGGRRLAVIDGETVRQGESFRGARLVRVGADEVELVRGAERLVLRLYPDAARGATPPARTQAAQ